MIWLAGTGSPRIRCHFFRLSSSMSYRSIKRVFGESNLERKILILACICLFLLIGTSFFLVNRITERSIWDNTDRRALQMYFLDLFKIHMEQNFVREPKNLDHANQGLRDAMIQLTKTLKGSAYESEFLTLTDDINLNYFNPKIATDPKVVNVIRDLVPRAREQQWSWLDSITVEPGKDPIQGIVEVDLDDAVFERYNSGDKVFFLTPVRFQQHCLHCHYVKNIQAEIADLVAQGKSELANQRKREAFEAEPIVFAKITVPFGFETRRAINKSRSLLMAFAIVTAFSSILAFYVIIRYVISKPLRHLRDVTEEVSHGRTDVRSSLNTGDEFEELSRSLNRMLRHLLDTQLALSSANSDLDRKVDEQAQLNMHLYEMNQIKGDFLANMSHELRTPLNSIIGFSEVLEDVDTLNDRQKKYVSNIRRSGRDLLELINNILDLAKLEAGKMEATPTEFPLTVLANNLCEMMRPLAEKKNIKLVLNARSDATPLFQDQIKVRQILTNLLSNAIKFTPEGGRINVEIERSIDNRVTIKVTDTGVGIPPSEQEVVFEKFRQGPAAVGENTLTREVSGTGLGLSIVKELCILLGGMIELESEVGKGSIFTVSLPASLRLMPKIHSEISKTIDEITKGQKVDFARTRNAPIPPAASGQSESGRLKVDSVASSEMEQ